MLNVKINANGDDGEQLKNELRIAVSAVGNLLDAMSMLTIHDRNYQTCEDPPTAYKTDSSDRSALCCSIRKVEQWLLLCYMAVDNQLPSGGDN